MGAKEIQFSSRLRFQLNSPGIIHTAALARWPERPSTTETV